MKKFLLFLIFTVFSMGGHAQVDRYQTRLLAITSVDSTGYCKWGEWNECDIDIDFDHTNNIIIVYSTTIQRYKVLDWGKWKTDDSGDVKLIRVYDQKRFNLLNIRLRIQKRNGVYQMYIDYLFQFHSVICYSGLTPKFD